MKMAALLVTVLVLGAMLGVPAYLTYNGVLTEDSFGNWLQNNFFLIWSFYPRVSITVPTGATV